MTDRSTFTEEYPADVNQCLYPVRFGYHHDIEFGFGRTAFMAGSSTGESCQIGVVAITVSVQMERAAFKAPIGSRRCKSRQPMKT